LKFSSPTRGDVEKQLKLCEDWRFFKKKKHESEHLKKSKSEGFEKKTTSKNFFECQLWDFQNFLKSRDPTPGKPGETQFLKHQSFRKTAITLRRKEIFPKKKDCWNRNLWASPNPKELKKKKHFFPLKKENFKNTWGCPSLYLKLRIRDGVANVVD